MSSEAITVRGLGKHYHIRPGPPPTMRETMSAALQRLIHPLARRTSAWQEVWTLRDINLDIRQGERVALLGANGAGKSTLLKILCRIVPPTLGEARLRGRVASILEVGTGFHPELTGRENIWLNAAILGMSRKEIADRFDRIVAFSGISNFLDTAVKRYSSGMYLRLAFAVAAHVDTEILVIDEVLAVGDQQFRRKCLEHLRGPELRDRTMVLVSHDRESIGEVATRGVVLDQGKLIFDGEIAQAFRAYDSISSQPHL